MRLYILDLWTARVGLDTHDAFTSFGGLYRNGLREWWARVIGPLWVIAAVALPKIIGDLENERAGPCNP
jgi:hypothetical protein